MSGSNQPQQAVGNASHSLSQVDFDVNPNDPGVPLRRDPQIITSGNFQRSSAPILVNQAYSIPAEAWSPAYDHTNNPDSRMCETVVDDTSANFSPQRGFRRNTVWSSQFYAADDMNPYSAVYEAIDNMDKEDAATASAYNLDSDRVLTNPKRNIIRRHPRVTISVAAVVVIAGVVGFLASRFNRSAASGVTTTPSPDNEDLRLCRNAIHYAMNQSFQMVAGLISVTPEQASEICFAVSVPVHDGCLAFLTDKCTQLLFAQGDFAGFLKAASTTLTAAVNATSTALTNSTMSAAITSAVTGYLSTTSLSQAVSSFFSPTSSTAAPATTATSTSTTTTTATEAPPEIDFSCPAVAAVTQGQSIAFSLYANAVTVQNAQVTGYLLTNLNGFQIFQSGSLVSPVQGQYVIPVASASDYVLVATQVGTGSFDFQVAALDMDGHEVDSFADNCSVTVNATSTTTTTTSSTTSTTTALTCCEALLVVAGSGGLSCPPVLNSCSLFGTLWDCSCAIADSGYCRSTTMNDDWIVHSTRAARAVYNTYC